VHRPHAASQSPVKPFLLYSCVHFSSETKESLKTTAGGYNLSHYRKKAQSLNQPMSAPGSPKTPG
jgi:hypothetical protein